MAQALFSTRADVVVVPVAVTDARGRAVAGLSAANFRLLDDGRAQAITLFVEGRAPLTLGLLLDDSQSTRPHVEALHEAVGAVLDEAGPNDELFLLKFNDRIGAPLFDGAPFTRSPDDIRALMAGAEHAGGTALHDAVVEALARVGRGSHARKALLVLSDGGDTASATSQAAMIAAARSTSAVVQVVVLPAPDEDSRRSVRVLRQLAASGTGTSYEARTDREVPTLARRAIDDLRAQYLIGFVPAPGGHADGAHTLRVTVRTDDGGNVSVRARPTYLPLAATPGEGIR